MIIIPGAFSVPVGVLVSRCPPCCWTPACCAPGPSWVRDEPRAPGPPGPPHPRERAGPQTTGVSETPQVGSSLIFIVCPLTLL